jgi:uncharacterized protein YndB with AHSA1/START domain
MSNNPFFSFEVDKKQNVVEVIRTFAAPQTLVWKTWTESSLLDQWWGPKPYNAITKSMDFSVGGKWLYAMTGPEGDEHWCFAQYSAIDPISSFSYTDSFCDADGTPSDFIAGSDWNIHFSEADGVTTLKVTITHKSLEDLEKVVEMGFKEGFTTGLNQLDELLKTNL